MRGKKAKRLRRDGKRKLPRRAGPRRLSREDAQRLGVRRPIKGRTVPPLEIFDDAGPGKH